MPLIAVPPIALIEARLPVIFPEGTEHRNYVIREMAARTVFVMFYAGAVEGSDRWIRPSQVTDMSTPQSLCTDEDDRELWVALSLSSGKPRSPEAWYATNSREPVRDETLRSGFIPVGAILQRTGIPTTSSKPTYAMRLAFAALFDPTLTGAALDAAIVAWQRQHLSKTALARVQLVKAGATVAADAVPVKFPNGETRMLQPGDSSVIAKAVIEVFAPKFLKVPAVLWLSESGNKVVLRDDALAKSLGFTIDPSKALPDIILVDLGAEGGAELLVVFTEVVASDGPITRGRKEVLTALAVEAGFSQKHLAFLTAYGDRAKSEFKKSVPELAWSSFAWFVSEPDNLIELHGNAPKLLSSLGDSIS